VFADKYLTAPNTVVNIVTRPHFGEREGVMKYLFRTEIFVLSHKRSLQKVYFNRASMGSCCNPLGCNYPCGMGGSWTVVGASWTVVCGVSWTVVGASWTVIEA